MKLKDKLINYVSDKEYRIIIRENSVSILNFSEIVDFASSFIKIRKDDKITIIKGNKLVISKIFDSEILISGIIEEVFPFT